MHVLLKYLGTVAAVILTIHLVPGISAIGGWLTILLVALVWSAVSLTLKPVLHLLALPITLLTLGLFSLVINALLFWLVAVIVPGFIVEGFIPALIGSVVLSIVSSVIHALIKPRNN